MTLATQTARGKLGKLAAFLSPSCDASTSKTTLTVICVYVQPQLMGCTEHPFPTFLPCTPTLLRQFRSPSGAQDLSPACLPCFSISSPGTASKPDWETLVAVSQHRAGEMPGGLVIHHHADGCHQRGRAGGDAQFRAHRCPLLLQAQPCWGQAVACCPGEGAASFEGNNSTNND